MSVVVAEWRPPDACRLQQALRLTNESFAEKLGAAPRTVAKWHANPSMRLTLEMQQALDTMLALAGDDDRERFTRLDATPRTRDRGGDEPWRRRLDADRNVGSALDWLDGIRHERAGISRREVEALLRDGGGDAVRERARAREGVDRATAARVVRDFYGDPPAGSGLVTVSIAGRDQATTMLTTPGWQRPGLDLLRGDGAAWALDHDVTAPPIAMTPEVVERAVQRVAEVLLARTRFVDALIYRMTVPPAGDGVSDGAGGGVFGVDAFIRYALTWDLLEAEVADVVLGATDRLAARSALLPTAGSVLDPGARVCVGGAQALCAFARPGRGESGGGDYLLLVQERSPRVVNATGRLAVIPKCFHQPISNAAEEVPVGRTILRELEEELFGRAELDAGAAGESAADPMHPSRLSAPMRWLHQLHGWDLQPTGFGFNLMSGNYEFASVMAVHDERFWAEHGGAIQANWEAARLRTVSSRDRAGLAALLNDPGWSDEGLVAFSLGLTRLAGLSPDRVDPPPVEIGVEA